MEKEQKKKHIAFWIIFPIGWTLLSALLIFYFDLANGPLVFFVFELVFLVALFVLRVLFRDKKKWVHLTIWGSFILLTISNMGFAQPSTRKFDATFSDNPTKVEDVLHLNEGDVQGYYNKDKTVKIYAGIKYAKAERWKEPEAFTWDGVRDGRYFGPQSMQPKSNSLVNSVIDIYSEKSWHPNYLMKPVQERSEEDGLNLNIWRPTEGTNLPILVFIHGGSLTNGSGASIDYNGESVAKKGVIMITIQYRLGVFGYFAHPDLKIESPNNTTGNYGLLDQIFALKWINQNAANFGGDKTKITIAGESAGSSSVSALCTSPLAKDLFRYAIGESSSLVMKKPPHTYRTPEKAFEVSKNILKEFKCKSIEELRKVPAEKLVKTKFSNSEMMLDGYALNDDPYNVYKAGNNNEIALLNGYNVKEADAFVVPNNLLSLPNKKNIKDKLTAYFGNEECAQKLCDLYKDDIEEDAFSALNTIMSVYWFIMPHHVWSNMAVASPKTSKVYRYQFTKENGYYGTYHSGEMIYAYGNLSLSPRQFAYDESDYKLQDTMLNYWVNFVKNGDPNGEGLPTWEEYKTNTDPVMELGENVGKIQDIYLKTYEILDEYLTKIANS